MNGILLHFRLPAAGRKNEPTVLSRTTLLGEEQGLHSTERGKSNRGDKLEREIITKQKTSDRCKCEPSTLSNNNLLTCEKNQY